MNLMQSGLTSGQTLAKIAAHAGAGGTLNVLQGGKFGHGFVAAGFTEALSPAVGQFADRNDFGTILAKTATSAAIGGTASVLSGGSFANGATTGAFQQLFNSTIHDAVDWIAEQISDSATKFGQNVLNTFGGDAEHSHVVDTWACNDQIQTGCTEANLFDEGLLYGPAPTFRSSFGMVPRSTPVKNGEVSFAFPVGDVTTFVYRNQWTIINVTNSEHMLDPGTITRSIYRSGSDLYIRTVGWGAGSAPALNNAGAPVIWQGVDMALLYRVPLWPRRR